MTGTLDGSQVNELVLEGLFGSINKIVKTEELIAQKSLADLNIKFLVLKHTPTRIFESYFEEMEYLVSHHERNKFIRNLALSLNGNTLILFAYVEKHGKILHEMISKKKQEDLHFVSGEVDGEIRDDIRSLVEKSDNAIIVASYGVFSTGVNVKNIHNIIFASPTKSRTRTLQSIGRGLRLSQTKTKCMIFDIADDVTHRGKKNYTMNHMLERAQIYASEGFPYEIHSIQLKESANDTNNVLQDL
jgi:superfamily II DNA or RNA helicase